MTVVSDRRAETSTPIHDLLAERWSPRSYDPAGTVSEEELRARRPLAELVNPVDWR